MVTAGDSSGDYEVDHHRETAHKHHRELDHRPWIRRSGERHLEEEILEVGLRGVVAVGAHLVVLGLDLLDRAHALRTRGFSSAPKSQH